MSLDKLSPSEQCLFKGVNVVGGVIQGIVSLEQEIKIADMQSHIHQSQQEKIV